MKKKKHNKQFCQIGLPQLTKKILTKIKHIKQGGGGVQFHKFNFFQAVLNLQYQNQMKVFIFKK